MIGSKQDGGREALLGGELGLLVDPFNPAEIAAAIHEVLMRTSREIPEGLEYFSFERFEERLAKVLQSSSPGSRCRTVPS